MEKIIRIGLIGLGQRGLATIARYAVVKGAEIRAVCDLRPAATATAQQMLAQQEGHQDVEVFQGEGQWEELCKSPNVDLVIVCTDWTSHTPIAVYAMKHGKDVAIEVPAATSVEECWQLVTTARLTNRRCTMLENCCYDTFHLGIMEMHRMGLFGEITHCEGAYIHDLRSDQGWMSYSVSGHRGNPYPTHGLGPICQLLGINDTDRLVSLVSMSAPNSLNNTLLKTATGKTILLQFDERTPRPYSRIQTLCGTKGYAQKYPLPTLQFDGQPPLTGKQAEKTIEKYHNKDIRRLVRKGRRLKVPNVMNYIMDCRLIRALQHNLPLDISVYDAALWSCVTELSAQSAAQGCQPITIPDFTLNH